MARTGSKKRRRRRGARSGQKAHKRRNKFRPPKEGNLKTGRRPAIPNMRVHGDRKPERGRKAKNGET